MLYRGDGFVAAPPPIFSAAACCFARDVSFPTAWYDYYLLYLRYLLHLVYISYRVGTTATAPVQPPYATSRHLPLHIRHPRTPPPRAIP